MQVCASLGKARHGAIYLLIVRRAGLQLANGGNIENVERFIAITAVFISFCVIAWLSLSLRNGYWLGKMMKIAYMYFLF